MSAAPSIFADTESSSTVWIRIEGKGTFQNSPGLKDFTTKLIADGRRNFVVDLKNCPTMDSTFMGALAAVALRLKASGGGKLWVVNQNQRTNELLTGLGIDTLFSTDPMPDQSAAGEGEAVNFTADKAQTREVMQEAHEACVTVNPANAAHFKDVLEYLKASASR